jgi:hypothetical protein
MTGVRWADLLSPSPVMDMIESPVEEGGVQDILLSIRLARERGVICESARRAIDTNIQSDRWSSQLIIVIIGSYN